MAIQPVRELRLPFSFLNGRLPEILMTGMSLKPTDTAIAYAEVTGWSEFIVECEPEKSNVVVWATIGEFASAA